MLKEKILNSFSCLPSKIFKLVQIREEKILNFKNQHQKTFLSLNKKLNKAIQSHFLKTVEKTLNFLFFIRTLDFSLWKNQNYHYSDLKNNLLKIFQENKNPENFLLQIDLKQFRELLGFTEDIKISQTRLNLLKEKIKWLFRKYEGSFLNFLKENPTPEKFCFSLFCFKDFQDYYKIKGKKVFILKPNQLLYFACQMVLKEIKKEKPTGLEELTIFADSVLPGVLRQKGILEYNKKLEEKIKNNKIIKYGSDAEIALRVNTIIACEKLAQELNLSSWMIDQLLWLNYSGSSAKRKKIITHKTFSYFY